MLNVRNISQLSLRNEYLTRCMAGDKRSPVDMFSDVLGQEMAALRVCLEQTAQEAAKVKLASAQVITRENDLRPLTAQCSSVQAFSDEARESLKQALEHFNKIQCLNLELQRLRKQLIVEVSRDYGGQFYA